MAKYKLHCVGASGNSYKVRLLLAQLGLPYRLVPLDILKGESRTAEFRRVNPFGRVPAGGNGPSRVVSGTHEGHDNPSSSDVQDRLNQNRIVPGDPHERDRR